VLSIDALRGIAAGNVPPSPPPKAGTFYSVAFTVRTGADREYYLFYYVPPGFVAGNARDPGELAWFAVTGALARDLRAGAAVLRPFRGVTAWPTELKSPGRIGVQAAWAGEDSALRERDRERASLSPMLVATLLLSGVLTALFATFRRPWTTADAQPLRRKD
jgi:hypothetical protein